MSAAIGPVIHCAACRRAATTLHFELFPHRRALMVWFECHGEHRLVWIDIREAGEGPVPSHRVEDVGTDKIKLKLENERLVRDESTRRLQLLEKFIAAEQRTRR